MEKVIKHPIEFKPMACNDDLKFEAVQRYVIICKVFKKAESSLLKDEEYELLQENKLYLDTARLRAKVKLTRIYRDELKSLKWLNLNQRKIAAEANAENYITSIEKVITDHFTR